MRERVSQVSRKSWLQILSWRRWFYMLLVRHWTDCATGSARQHASCMPHGIDARVAANLDGKSLDTKSAVTDASTRRGAKSEPHGVRAGPRRMRSFGHVRGGSMMEFVGRARSVPHARLCPFRLGHRC